MKKLLLESFSFLFGLIMFKKNKNVWVFGSWQGKRYSDNPKYLFEYILKNHKEIRPIWITSNKHVLEKLKVQGYEVYFNQSLRGMYYSSIAGVACFSHRISDINFRGLLWNTKLVQLWHGIPIKKINMDVQRKRGIINRIKTKVQEIEFRKYSLLIATSNNSQSNMNSAFGSSETQITGLPRNDIFFCDLENNNNKIKNITFLPTFRETIGESYLYFLEEENINKLYTFLKEKDLNLLLKMHEHDINAIKIAEIYSDKIKIVSNMDVQDLLLKTDILITDYSSCYIDFLLTTKPIIFSIPDIDTYLNKDRNLYYNYNKIMAGYKVSNINDLLESINIYCTQPNTHIEERTQMKLYFHENSFGHSCENVYKRIKELLPK